MITATLWYIVANFSYYDLTVQKCEHDASYTIHGLWPEYNIHSWPQFCNKTKYEEFNKTVLSRWSRISEMHDNWRSCIHQPHKDDWSFWRHEWEKHGTCTDLNITEFFSRALDLYSFHQGDIYECCNRRWMRCLLKFDREYRYQQRCHKYI